MHTFSLRSIYYCRILLAFVVGGELFVVQHYDCRGMWKFLSLVYSTYCGRIGGLSVTFTWTRSQWVEYLPDKLSLLSDQI